MFALFYYNMEKEVFDSFVEAGKVAEEMLKLAMERAKPGKKLLYLANELEAKAGELGSENAFPANLSRNHEAAHYTPSVDDETVIGERDVLKVDVGAHINGYASDCAITLDFSGENGKLLEASEFALEVALSMMKPGVNVREIGKAIEREITTRGFKPISNLSGHKIEQFELHAGVNIPNVESGNYVLQVDDVFAVEPFSTTGYGAVQDGGYTEIFELIHSATAKARLPSTRRVLQVIQEKYPLPFAKRWLYSDLPDLQPFSINAAVKELQNLNVIYPHPVLVEKEKGLISQFETTVIITEDDCLPIVKLPK